MSKIGATVQPSSSKAISYHKKDICTICVQPGEGQTEPENPLKKKTLTSDDHLKLGVVQPTSGPWEKDWIPVASNGTASIRRTIAALRVHLDSKQRASKRKNSVDVDEVDCSPRKRARRAPSEEESLKSDSPTSPGSSRAETADTPGSSDDEVPVPSGANQMSSLGSSSGNENCNNQSAGSAAVLATQNVASTSTTVQTDTGFRFSTQGKQAFLNFVAEENVTAARQLIPEEESVMVIKGADKVAAFYLDHDTKPKTRKDGQVRTEIHVCVMKIWAEDGKVEYNQEPCYLYRGVDKVAFATHDNLVRHHKNVHFGIERADPEKDKEGEKKTGEKKTKAGGGKQKRSKNNDDDDYTGGVKG